MYQVKTYNAIAPAGLAQFTNDYQLNESDQPDAYLIRSVDLHQEALPQSLKVIARAGAGVNNIPLGVATANGTAVFNTPGSNANAVKELVIGLLIVASRNLMAAANYSAQHTEADVSQRTEHDKTQFNGTELLGKTLAVIGLGHVGSLVANAALNLGMNVIGYDPYLSADAAWNIAKQVQRASSIEMAVKHADYVTVHVPKNEDTLNLLGAKEIAAMPENAQLFNYARGGIVDNTAVLAAIKTGHIAHYYTDFGEPQLANQAAVTVTPHIGGSTLEAEVNGATQAAQTIMTYLETGNVQYAINLPTLTVPFNAAYRFTVIHENVPNMVSQITQKLAAANLNIATMANAAKAGTAYTIIDVDDLDHAQSQQLIDALNQIPAVARVRLLIHH
ncbi:phosphoglycerate dehydrogenase [Lactiplantibacillus mudanjiangensis]|uniref:D-3-phosphoglycerate dehydrogenase n=1 Tax=Lactiplantibacillus mudanjiangensis TaxID=1296538 RepID=A0A660E1B4_9LACO|nr:phosphoglycerate dehydrogenase [Lactiplantibacillus mudanjiangensis]VDG21165.1 3-phosphoglycerate dehydrogenase [Lactobacillus sp.] [Lactiplantibacillus mudanjiangensis]VDG22898.1 3-phosphoglycerate dehydrogenase [Lactobacillus sp.] [Lactiplantibacillus mudanjiangensis]VDG29242.1 3-phosphoglycerate dehydrogenase [Lactobacillus sp.] [Lactiplantibacillus mudanjiangensis]VDG31768.1 3-phosphoglycerate dehydrogenase [Lactobacillus sp.] [Lactiplantibacillus mudanjiangensis]